MLHQSMVDLYPSENLNAPRWEQKRTEGYVIVSTRPPNSNNTAPSIAG
jgi:hypothetical protein